MKGGHKGLSLSVLLIILIICTNTSTGKVAIFTPATISEPWNYGITESIAEEELLMESGVSQRLLEGPNAITYPPVQGKQPFCHELQYDNCLPQESKITRDHCARIYMCRSK